jgi:hypothetical protein
VNSLGSHEIPDGEYLYDAGSKEIEYQWAQGIGSDKAPAPQARLMATVINGILNQRLPWRLVLMGVALVIAVEILGVRSLAFATGSYLSIATTGAMFAGNLIRLLVGTTEKRRKRGQPGRVVLFRTDRGGRRLWPARHCLAVVADAAKPEISWRACQIGWRWAETGPCGVQRKLAIPTGNRAWRAYVRTAGGFAVYFARKKLD